MNITFESLIKWLENMPRTAPVRFAENGDDNTQREAKDIVKQASL